MQGYQFEYIRVRDSGIVESGGVDKNDPTVIQLKLGILDVRGTGSQPVTDSMGSTTCQIDELVEKIVMPPY